MEFLTYEFVQRFVFYTVFTFIVAFGFFFYLYYLVTGIFWLVRQLKKYFKKDGKRHE